MYVKKFEGESLTETLNLVKQDLGPDAIILKTITNKGLKGAFKKSKIEITAAISEESYTNKAKVDKVLNSEQKNSFYSSPAKDINSSIKSYNKGTQEYGSMGLNKVVKTVSKASNKLMNSLDDFLGAPQEEPSQVINEAYTGIEENDYSLNDSVSFKKSHEEAFEENTLSFELKNELQLQKNKIDILESRIETLMNELESKRSYVDQDENIGLSELKSTLKTLDLSDKVIQDISKKALFDLSKEELNNPEVVFEFALRTINESIKTERPLFASPDLNGSAVVTALVSDMASGQSSMAIKLAILNDKSKVIKFRSDIGQTQEEDFISRLFGVEYSITDSLSTMLSEIRKSINNGESVILDIKTFGSDEDFSKKMLETLKRSFEFIEILISTCAINSEVYNRKIISKYKDFSDGVIISYVDQCMSFGSLLNMHYANLDLPLKFFGTGQTVPDDIEAASAERILASMFRL